MPQTKVATCCYCGTRAALVLSGTTAHELACSSCGAPLHNLKMLPKSKVGKDRELVKPSRVRARQEGPKDTVKWDKRGKKKKKKKSLGRKLMSEAWDILEDILD